MRFFLPKSLLDLPVKNLPPPLYDPLKSFGNFFLEKKNKFLIPFFIFLHLLAFYSALFYDFFFISLFSVQSSSLFWIFAAVFSLSNSHLFGGSAAIHAAPVNHPVFFFIFYSLAPILPKCARYSAVSVKFSLSLFFVVKNPARAKIL